MTWSRRQPAEHAQPLRLCWHSQTVLVGKVLFGWINNIWFSKTDRGEIKKSMSARRRPRVRPSYIIYCIMYAHCTKYSYNNYYGTHNSTLGSHQQTKAVAASRWHHRCSHAHAKHTDAVVQTLGQDTAGTPYQPLWHTTHRKMHTRTHTKFSYSHCPTSCPLRTCHKVWGPGQRGHRSKETTRKRTEQTPAMTGVCTTCVFVCVPHHGSLPMCFTALNPNKVWLSLCNLDGQSGVYIYMHVCVCVTCPWWLLTKVWLQH